MVWLVLFLISWIIFLILIDFRYLKISIIGGITAVIMQVIVDRISGNLGLYRVSGGLIMWFGNSTVFYTLGSPLTIGSIYIQYYPNKKWLKIINVAVCSLLFLFAEILLEMRGVLIYTNWSRYYSYLVNIFAFTVLGWIREAFLPPWKSGDGDI